MKRIGLILSIMFLSSVAYAGAPVGKAENIWSGTTVAGTGATIVSRVFNVASVKNVGLWSRLDQAVPATPSHTSSSHVSIYMEAAYANTPSSIFATVSTITRNVNTVSTVNTLTYPNMPYIRFRATGLSSQATDSTVTAYVFTQE